MEGGFVLLDYLFFFFFFFNPALSAALKQRTEMLLKVALKIQAFLHQFLFCDPPEQGEGHCGKYEEEILH